MVIGTTRFFGNNSELFSRLNSELQSLQTQAGTGKTELKLSENITDISKLSAAEEKKSETPVTEEASVEVAKETKTEEASPQEDSKAKEEPKEEIPAEKKAEEAETKS